MLMLVGCHQLCIQGQKGGKRENAWQEITSQVVSILNCNVKVAKS